MKVWILVLAVSSLTVPSQTCPPGHFSAVIVASIDQTVEDPVAHIEDPKLLFLRKGLHFEEEEIKHVFDDAINFFNSTFGLDFSDSPPNEENQRYLENALMYTFVLRKDINYIATANSWIRNGNTRSRCYRIYDGGIAVRFLNYTTLHGKYGGNEGKPAGPYDFLTYGFYSIDACEQSPVLIHYRCPTPVRPEPIDGAYIGTCYALNRALGRGRTHDISIVRPDQGKYHITFRSVLTFTSRPGGEQDNSVERDGPGEREGPGDMERPRMRE